ncbi:hypothetical protein B0H10DRAFT_1959445 [Mycena sp. CBHHK59/15]|nr:hypothetical protein B0H10DRAFT_1959445 [Mycena sp. CBHHK59/15]
MAIIVPYFIIWTLLRRRMIAIPLNGLDSSRLYTLGAIIMEHAGHPRLRLPSSESRSSGSSDTFGSLEASIGSPFCPTLARNSDLLKWIISNLPQPVSVCSFQWSTGLHTEWVPGTISHAPAAVLYHHIPQALTQPQNLELEHLREEVLVLHAENAALKSNFQALVQCLQTNSSNSVAQPAAAMLPSLEQSDYPDTKLWQKSSWTARIAKDAGRSKMNKATRNSLMFIEDKHGNPPSEDCIAEFTAEGIAPYTWGQASLSAQDQFRAKTEADIPELRLCDGHWKDDDINDDPEEITERLQRLKNPLLGKTPEARSSVSAPSASTVPSHDDGPDIVPVPQLPPAIPPAASANFGMNSHSISAPSAISSSYVLPPIASSAAPSASDSTMSSSSGSAQGSALPPVVVSPALPLVSPALSVVSPVHVSPALPLVSPSLAGLSQSRLKSKTRPNSVHGPFWSACFIHSSSEEKEKMDTFDHIHNRTGLCALRWKQNNPAGDGDEYDTFWKALSDEEKKPWVERAAAAKAAMSQAANGSLEVGSGGVGNRKPSVRSSSSGERVEAGPCMQLRYDRYILIKSLTIGCVTSCGIALHRELSNLEFPRPRDTRRYPEAGFSLGFSVWHASPKVFILATFKWEWAPAT